MYSSSGPTGQLLHFVRAHSRRLGWTAIFAGLIFQSALLFQHMGAYAAGSDSSGYMNMAKLLASGESSVSRRRIDPDPISAPLVAPGDYTFVPLGFRPAGEGRMVATYPIGLPLVIAGAGSIVGWLAAPGIVIGGHAVMALILFFLLGRAWGLPRGWCAFGTLVLGGCPLFLMFSIQCMSDVPAMTWVLASVYLAWKSRDRTAFALGAGAAVGMAVLVRPTNVLAALPVLALLGIRPRQWFLLTLAGAPFALLFFGYNRAAYGNPFETGYGNVHGMLASRYVLPTLENYTRWLPVLLTPFLLLVPGVAWGRTAPVAVRATILSWILAILGFYAFYEPTHEVWWYLRFTLPAFPPLILAFLLTGYHIAGRRHFRLFEVGGSGPAIAVSFALLAGIVSNSLYWGKKLYPFSSREDERQYYDACRWAEAHLPDDAVVASLQLSGSLFFYTRFPVVRWDTLNDTARAHVDQALQRTQRPFYLLELELESQRALREYLPGVWREVAKIRNVRVLKREEGATASSPFAP
jgi:hypothetical protein